MVSIAYKELFPIAIAENLWGHFWSSRRVEFLSGNKSVVVDILKSDTAKDPNLMSLFDIFPLWHDIHLQQQHDMLEVRLEHVRGKLIPSRFQCQPFRQLAPHADEVATAVPQSLIKDLAGA